MTARTQRPSVVLRKHFSRYTVRSGATVIGRAKCSVFSIYRAPPAETSHVDTSPEEAKEKASVSQTISNLLEATLASECASDSSATKSSHVMTTTAAFLVRRLALEPTFE